MNVVNVHWILASAAQIIFTFLPAHVGEKLTIKSGNGAENLLKIIDANSL